MQKTWRIARWLVPGMALLQLGSCYSQPQLVDFLRTEVARLTSDALGQLFTIFSQAT